jgi:hypothetical protein
MFDYHVPHCAPPQGGSHLELVGEHCLSEHCGLDGYPIKDTRTGRNFWTNYVVLDVCSLIRWLLFGNLGKVRRVSGQYPAGQPILSIRS